MHTVRETDVDYFVAQGTPSAETRSGLAAVVARRLRGRELHSEWLFHQQELPLVDSVGIPE